MKLCYIADISSPHARRLIRFFVGRSHEVHVISTAPMSAELEGCTVHNLSGAAVVRSSTISRFFPTRCFSAFHGWLQGLKDLSSVNRHRVAVSRLLDKINPDLLHCLRLPIEGYLGGLTNFRPMAVSSWGNDLLLWSSLTPLNKMLTERCLANTDLFVPDTNQDLQLARRFGLTRDARTIVMPATGGIDYAWLPSAIEIGDISKDAEDSPLLVSSRGFGNIYVNTPVLVEAVPFVLQAYPRARFLLDGNYNSPSYRLLRDRLNSLGLNRSVQLTNRIPQAQLMKSFHAAAAYVSVTLFDGLPISMLEAMALGTIPVVSDLAPLHDWIRDGVNGFFVDPMNSRSIADGVIKAIRSQHRRHEIAEYNRCMLRERADCGRNLTALEMYYQEVVTRRRTSTEIPAQSAVAAE